MPLPALTVEQVATRLKNTLRDFGDGELTGEVQEARRPGSGHVYVTLTDGRNKIDCVMWRNVADSRLKVLPRKGALVRVHYTKADFYGPFGKLTLHIDQLSLTGDGDLINEKTRALERLRADGLCDPERKRPLPWLPRRIVVISGKDSEAKYDVETALLQRWPTLDIVHRPALVQGSGTVASIIDAIAHVQDAPGVDLVILARGGGSVADLHPFDDERLCRAVFACHVPVVTSIGHTQQRPNVEHVAAAYAEVPARIAELVVPDQAAVLSEIDRCERSTTRAAGYLEKHSTAIQALAGGLSGSSRLRESRYALSELEHGLTAGWGQTVAQQRLLINVEAKNVQQGAERQFNGYRDDLADLDDSLRQALSRDPAPELTRLEARLDGYLRQARANISSYDQALTRHERDQSADARRGLRRWAELIDQPETLTTRSGRRANNKAARELDVLQARIDSKDFVGRGYIPVTTADGVPVKSGQTLRPGDQLALGFHDTTVPVVVQDSEPESA